MEIALDLHERLESDLLAAKMSSKVLMNRFRFIEEASRKTAAYQDPNYAPFYYHLGKLITPKNMVVVGFGLGLLPGCLLKSCKSVETILAIEEVSEEFYSSRLGKANIRDTYRHEFQLVHGSVLDKKFVRKLNSQEWDLSIFDLELGYDKLRNYLDAVWARTALGGLLVMEYVSSSDAPKRAFFDFSKIVNREPKIYPTRYGTGILQK